MRRATGWAGRIMASREPLLDVPDLAVGARRARGGQPAGIRLGGHRGDAPRALAAGHGVVSATRRAREEWRDLPGTRRRPVRFARRGALVRTLLLARDHGLDRRRSRPPRRHEHEARRTARVRARAYIPA